MNDRNKIITYVIGRPAGIQPENLFISVGNTNDRQSLDYITHVDYDS